MKKIILRSNEDYQTLMIRVAEKEKQGEKSEYERLLSEADDLAEYIKKLTNEN